MNDAEEIKNRLDIVELVGSYMPLKKAGSNHKGLCPFHSEKTPSFMVNAERQIFKCFGCSESGDAITFIEKMEHLTFPEALQVLADRAGYKLTKYELRSTNYGKEQEDIKSKLYQINSFVAQVYHKILTEHPVGKNALEYLNKRGVSDKTIAAFRLGYSPIKPVVKDLLIKKGSNEKDIYTAGSPDKFKDRIIFPIMDVLGNVLGFTGRALSPDIQPKYYNTPETPIFTKGRILYGLAQAKAEIKQKNYAVLVEGQMDVVMCHQSGVVNTIASSGTALTSDHLKIIKRYTDNLIVSFDMDEAGQKATLMVFELSQRAEMNLKVALLPTPYKDAGEAIAKDADIFKKALKDAPYAMEWIIEKVKSEKLKVKSAEELSPIDKKEIVKEVAPYLARFRDDIEQLEWIGRIASKIDTKAESILAVVEKYLSKEGDKIVEEESQTLPTKKHLSEEEMLFGLLTLNQPLQKKHQTLYRELELKYNKGIEDIKEAVLEYQKTLTFEDIEQEEDRLIGRRKESQTEQVKKEFAKEIAQAETQGDREKVKQLLKELQKKI